MIGYIIVLPPLTNYMRLYPTVFLLSNNHIFNIKMGLGHRKQFKGKRNPRSDLNSSSFLYGSYSPNLKPNIQSSFESSMNINLHQYLPKPLILAQISSILPKHQHRSPNLKKPNFLLYSKDSDFPCRDNLSPLNRTSISVCETHEFPITGSQALRRYKDFLTYREKEEILSYDKVWYIGLTAEKLPGKCYDDKGGEYHIVIRDHLQYRYEVIDILGKGSYGTVLKCKDHKKAALVAVKIFKNKSYIRSQGLNEILILRSLADRDKGNCLIVSMHESFEFRGHLCMSLELLNMSLYSLIKNNSFQGLSVGIVRKFAYQLLNILNFLKKNRVIHADLKPDNIMLLESKSSLKLIDFDSACIGDNKIFTYIQTRYYRAPEIILSMPYDYAIDMWSFACVIVEMLTGYPLFPAKDEIDLLSMIIEVRGLPPIDYIKHSPKYITFFDNQGNPRHTQNFYGIARKSKARSLLEVIPNSDLRLLDLLYKCLDWDPRKRIKPEEALQHEWITLGNHGNTSNIYTDHKRKRLNLSL